MHKKFAFIIFVACTLFYSAGVVYAGSVQVHANKTQVHSKPASIKEPKEPRLTFIDVPKQTHYETAISSVVSRGYMKGNKDGLFRINEKITRLEVVHALMKAFGSTVDKEPEIQVFRDVRKNDPEFALIAEAEKTGALDGIQVLRNYFKPKMAVTTGEALHIFNNIIHRNAQEVPVELRYEIKTLLPDEWKYESDLRLALYENTIMQKSDGTLNIDPIEKLSRGDFAVLLYRLNETRNTGTGFGMASWYGDGLSKTEVPNEDGRVLREQFLTCAHRKLQFGTILKVTNQINGKTVKVVVNDRGPYIPGRIIDLSRSAFTAIEDIGSGTAAVKIEIAKYEE